MGSLHRSPDCPGTAKRLPTSKSTRIISFRWLGSKFIPAMYQGELMLSAASKIFSVTISILPLRASHRLLPPAVADRVAALPMKEDRRGKIKSYPPATHSDFNRGEIIITGKAPSAERPLPALPRDEFTDCMKQGGNLVSCEHQLNWEKRIVIEACTNRSGNT